MFTNTTTPPTNSHLPRIAALRTGAALLPGGEAAALLAPFDRLDKLRARLVELTEQADGEHPSVSVPKLDPAELTRERASELANAETVRSWAVGARRAFDEGAETAAGAELARVVPLALAKLAPVFDRATSALCKAAASLPAGDPFDQAAIMASHATRALADAHVALDAIAAIGSVYRYTPGQVTPEVGIPAMQALRVVRLPETAAVRTGDLDSEQGSTNGHVRALLRDYTADPRAALTRLARGEYGECALSLATDADELADRERRIPEAYRWLKFYAVA